MTRTKTTVVVSMFTHGQDPAMAQEFETRREAMADAQRLEPWTRPDADERAFDQQTKEFWYADRPGSTRRVLTEC